MTNGSEISRSNILNNLFVGLENINTNNSIVKIGVSGLDDIIVHVFLVVILFQTLENEFENSLQIFRGRGSNVNV